MGSKIGDITFLFGAGASMGGTSHHVVPHTPPLMTELYGQLAHRFPDSWGHLSPRALNSMRYEQDFEKAFVELELGKAPGLPPGVPGASGLQALEAQRPLAVYFSEFLLNGD